MGKWLVILGIVLTIVGFGGMMVSIISTVQNVADPSQFDKIEQQLCQPGEKLEQETGAYEYQPGGMSGRPVRYFCIDNEGQRREVTGTFVQGLFGQVTGGLIPGLSATFLFTGLMTLGIPLVVVGIILMVMKRSRDVANLGQGQFYTMSSGQGSIPVQLRGQSVNLSPEMQQFFQQIAANPNPRADLKTRLQQLEQARQAGLISQEEYDRLRQKILSGDV